MTNESKSNPSNIQILLDEARNASQSGRFDDAEESLRLLREIAPQNPEIAEEQILLTKLNNLYDEICRARANAENKSNSPVERQKALKEGLDIFRMASPELVGEELPEKIVQLLRFNNDAYVLTDSQNYERARRLIGDFRKAPGAPNCVIREALNFADDWLKLAWKNALEGTRESAAVVGDLVGAYRAATQLVASDPTNDRYLRTRRSAHEALVQQQTQSAAKRYSWAEEAFATGDFERARKDLDAIEEQFFKPVETAFPGLFENVPQVEETRKNILSLQREIEKGQISREIARPILDTARGLFSKNQFREAEEKLDELERYDLDPAARAWKEAAALRARIQKAHARAETKKLGAFITEKESAFSIALPDDYVDLLQQVNDVPQTIDFSIILVEAEEKKRYDDLHAKIATGLNNYRQHAQSMLAGKDALEKGEYEQAADLFRQARDTAPDASSKMTAEIELKKVEERGKAQSALKGALEKAHNLLDNEQYESARDEFQKISAFGAEWEEVAKQGSELARAGIWYLQANANAEAGRQNEAQTALETAQTLAGKWQELKASDMYAARRCSSAQTVKEKIDALSINIQKRDEIEREKQQQQTEAMKRAEGAAQARRTNLLQAQEELAQGRYLPAKQIAEEILREDPNNVEAKTIWDDTVKGLAQEVVREKLQEAANFARQDKREKVEKIVDEVLRDAPDNQDAKSLQALMITHRYFGAGRFERAAETIESAPRFAPIADLLDKQAEEIKEKRRELSLRLVVQIAESHKKRADDDLNLAHQIKYYEEALSKYAQHEKEFNEKEKPPTIREIESLKNSREKILAGDETEKKKLWREREHISKAHTSLVKEIINLRSRVVSEVQSVDETYGKNLLAKIDSALEFNENQPNQLKQMKDMVNEIEGALKFVNERKPWYTALSFALLYFAASGYLLWQTYSESIGASASVAEFPVKIVMCAGLFGFALNAGRRLSKPKSRIMKWVDVWQLVFLDPLIRAMFTLLVVSVVYSGTVNLNISLGTGNFWAYFSLSGLISYSSDVPISLLVNLLGRIAGSAK